MLLIRLVNCKEFPITWMKVSFAIIGTIVWVLLPPSNEKENHENHAAEERVDNNIYKYRTEARLRSRSSRFVKGIFLVLDILGSLMIGWLFTNLTNNWDYFTYGIGSSVGILLIYHLVTNVIRISENRYVNNLIQNDLIEVQNKNSNFLEILLFYIEKVLAPDHQALLMV